MRFLIKRSKKNGFSLVEVLVATSILGAGLVGAAKFQGSVVKDSTLTKQRIQAVHFARDKMAELKHFATSAEYEAKISSNANSVTTQEAEKEGDTALYTLSWTITPKNKGMGAAVSVKVSWPNPMGEGGADADSTIYLATMVSNASSERLTLTPIGPKPMVPNPPISFPNFDPADVTTQCKCSSGSAYAFNTIESMPSFGFVKVSGDGDDDDDDEDYYEGGMDGDWDTGSKESTTTGLSDECELCCDQVATETAAAEQLKKEQYFAHLDKIEKELLQKARYGGDQVLSNGTLNWKHFRKGYDRNSLEVDINKFLIRTSGESSDSSDSSDSSSSSECSSSDSSDSSSSDSSDSSSSDSSDSSSSDSSDSSDSSSSDSSDSSSSDSSDSFDCEPEPTSYVYAVCSFEYKIADPVTPEIEEEEVESVRKVYWRSDYDD